MARRRTTIGDILARVLVNENGCWIWPGSTRNGYGRAYFGGKVHYVHRLIYEHFKGPLPAGKVLHHVPSCRNKLCANFDHVSLLTPREHYELHAPIPHHSRGQTHCKRGHPLSGDNLFVSAKGGRDCKTCRREGDRRRYKEEMGGVVLQRSSERTHCPAGHPYEGDNLGVKPSNGERYCKTCRQRIRRKSYEKNKA